MGRPALLSAPLRHLPPFSSPSPWPPVPPEPMAVWSCGDQGWATLHCPLLPTVLSLHGQQHLS